MDFTKFHKDLLNAMKRYKKKADNYGVSNEDWNIDTLTPNLIRITTYSGSGSELLIKVTQTNDKITVLVFPEENEDWIDVSTRETAGVYSGVGIHLCNNFITYLDDCIDYIISNIM